MLIYGSFLIKTLSLSNSQNWFLLYSFQYVFYISSSYFMSFYSFGTLFLTVYSISMCALHIKRWMWIWLLQSTHLLNGKSQLDVWHVHKSIFHTECMSNGHGWADFKLCCGMNWDSIRASINLTFHYYL